MHLTGVIELRIGDASVQAGESAHNLSLIFDNTLTHDLLEKVTHAFHWFTPHSIVILSCMVCLSQVSQNCNVYTMRLPSY